MFEKEGAGRKRARAMLNKSGYRAGGHVTAKHVGEAMVSAAGGQPPNKAKPRKLADGGTAMEGEAPSGRLDKPSRGGKKGMTVNIVVGAPKAEPAAAPMPMPVPMPPRPAPRPQMPMGQQPNPMAAAMPGPGGPAAALSPTGMKSGGRLGGKPGAPMTAGAVSGVGRKELTEIQKKARK